MESDMPIELVAARLWSGTKWHYPNAERMVEENKRLRADLAQRTAELAKANAERDEARREVCLSSCRLWIPEHHLTVAAERGWDCFNAKETR